jgi:hypothetical protein
MLTAQAFSFFLKFQVKNEFAISLSNEILQEFDNMMRMFIDKKMVKNHSYAVGIRITPDLNRGLN